MRHADVLSWRMSSFLEWWPAETTWDLWVAADVVRGAPSDAVDFVTL
jgi:hypothetical protein